MPTTLDTVASLFSPFVRRRLFKKAKSSSQGVKSALDAPLGSGPFVAGFELLEPRVLLATRTWTGGGANGDWANTANWSGGNIPGQDDLAVFPAGISNNAITINKSAANAEAISITGTGYTFTGSKGITIDANSNGTNPGIFSAYNAGTKIGVNSFDSININMDNGATARSLSADANDTLSFIGTTVLSNSSPVTFTGGGTVVLGDGTAAKNTISGAVTIASGTTVKVEKDSAFGTSAITVSGNGAGSGAIINVSGTNKISGAVTIAADATFAATAGSLEFTGVVDDAANQGVTIAGNGTIIFSNANNAYDGVTTINSGATLIAAADSAMGDNSTGSATTWKTVVASGGTLGFLGGITYTSTPVEPVDLSGTISNVSGDNTFSGPLTLLASSKVAVASGSSLTLSGVINDGASTFNLASSGAGTLILNQTETYNGTTDVSAGVFEVTGSIAASSKLNLTGGSLIGTGTVPQVVASTGTNTIAPGTGGTNTGILTVAAGGMALGASSTYSININGTTAGTNYDQTKVTGGVSLGNATLDLHLGFTPAVGNTFVIVDNVTAGAVVGTFLGLAEGATFSSGGNDYSISYKGGTGGNDVVLTALNHAPVITSNGGLATAAVSVAEGSTAVTTVAASDSDSDTRTYTVSGTDASKFTINTATGVLTFTTAPDFEAPTDSGTNNIYNITVQASDGKGGADTQDIAVTVTDVNDAPTLSGTFTMPPATENVGASTSQTVTQIVHGSTYSDPDGTDSAMAITAYTGNGTWQYSTNGTQWNTFGTVSDASALLLSETTNIRFEPDGDNGETATITFRAWDTTNGATASSNFTRRTGNTTTNGGTTAYSTGTATAQIIVSDVNDAPTLSGGPTELTGINPSTLSGPIAVSDIIAGTTYNDVDNGSVSGIALYGTTITTGGSWSYSSTAGGTYTAVGTVSATSALLLPSTYFLKYQSDTTGGDATLSFRAWDQTSDTAGTKVNPGTGGTTTAYSTAAQNASARLTVLSAPVVSGGPSLFNSINENTTSAAKLVSAIISDLGGTYTDANSGDPKSIAITSYTGHGTWQYSTNGFTGWTAFGSVSDSAALLLSSTTSVRYVPDSANGETATFTFHGWDETSGTASANSAPSTGDTTSNGGASAYSTGTANASIAVTSLNDAPTLSGGPVVLVSSPPGNGVDGPPISVATIIAGVTYGDVDTGALKGIAVSTESSNNGTWRYSADGSTGWTDFPTGLSTNNAFLLPNTYFIRFHSTSAAGAGTKSITFYAWDQFSGTAGGTADPTPGGNATAFSTGTATANLVVQNLPVITSNSGGDSASISKAEGTTAVTTVTATDADADTRTYTVSGTDASKFTINTASGVLTFTSAPDYENPTDAGTNNIYDIVVQAADGKGGFDTQAIAITITDVNEFTPAITSTAAYSVPENAGTAVGTVTASDGDTANVLTYSLTGTDAGDFNINTSSGVLTFVSTPNFNSPADSDTNNIYTFNVVVSDGSKTSSQATTVTVTNVNDAPTLSGGPYVLTSVNSATTSAGVTVSTILGGLTYGDVDAGAVGGAAITGTTGAGTWEYSTDGVTWNSFGGGLSAGTALLLSAGTQVHYIPSISSAETASFTMSAWDTTSDTASTNSTRNYGNSAVNGLATAYSMGSATVQIVVTISNVDPVITSNSGGDYAFATIPENTTAVTDVDATDADGNSLTYTITGSGADDALFTINTSTGVLAFLSAPNFEVKLDAGTDNVYDVQVQVADGKGGFDTQDIAVTVSDVNEFTPAVTSTAAYSVPENTAASFATVTATDGDTANALTYTLSGGDAGAFKLDSSTGALTFASNPNFEAPGDSNTDNVYTFDVVVSDGTNSSSQPTTVTVTDVNESTPAITSTATYTVAENSGTALDTVTATDGDTADSLTYTLTGTDAGKFTINTATGVLTFNANPNFEAPDDSNTDNVYSFDVVVSDGTNSSAQPTTVTVTDVNEFTPAVTSTATYTVAENPGTALDTVTATDGDGSASLTYTLTGTDAGQFNIDSSTGVLTFVSTPDFESADDSNTDNVYSFDVVVSDGTNSSSQPTTVTVTDVNEFTPAVTSTAAYSVPENTAASFATVTATDGDGSASLTYTITGTDAGKFNINTASGVLTFNANPNFESPDDTNTDNVYTFNVVVSDGTNSSAQPTTVTVTDVNEFTPAVTSTATYTVAENPGTALATVTATDGDGSASLTYTLTGMDSDAFDIDPVTGELTFVSAPDFESPDDMNTDNVYSFNVVVSDGTKTSAQATTVTVTDVNEFSPVITSTAAVTVSDGATTALNVTATDGDGSASLTYTIIGGSDAGDFTINSSTGVLSFSPAADYSAPADSDTNNVYNVQVRVSDGSTSDSQSIAITVSGNIAPAITSNGGTPSASFSQNEGLTSATTVTATDADADPLTYTISGGADSSKFTINTSSGVLTFVTAPNYEAPNDAGTDHIYNVQVQVSDGIATDTQTLAITILDVNEFSPVITSTAAVTVSDGATAALTVTATDGDTADTLTYTIIGGSDAGDFTINSSTGVLSFSPAADYSAPADSDTNNVYNVQVRVSDGTTSDSQSIAITVSGNIAPVITSNGGTPSASFSQNEGLTSATTVTATDANADPLTYSISGGADSSKFSINTATGVLTFVTAPDYEAPSDAGTNHVYDVQVQVYDGIATDTQTLAITILPVNETPAITSNGGGAAASTSVLTGTTAVTTVHATDPDLPADTLTYSITGGADSSKFTINTATGALTFTTAPDFLVPTDAGTNNVYDVTVQASDGTLTDSQDIAVTVFSSAEVPGVISFVTLSFNPIDVTPGQTVHANVFYLNNGTQNAFPHSVRIYRSSAGTLGTLDELLTTEIVDSLNINNGQNVTLSWIASAADANADGGTDGTSSSYLVVVVDEELLSGDTSPGNNWTTSASNDYTVTLPTVTIAPAGSGGSDIVAIEGQTNSGQFVLTRSGDTSAPLTVTLGYSGSASAADFAGGTLPSATTVTFAAFQATMTINVSPVIDNNATASETAPELLTLTVLSDPSATAHYVTDVLSSNGTPLSMTIIDAVPTINITATDASASENRSDPAKFRISRTGPRTQAVSVLVDLNSGDTDASQYIVTLGSATITFTLGQALITIPANKDFVDLKFTPIDDGNVEGPQTINPIIFPAPGLYPTYLVGTASATATLTDNDGQTNVSTLAIALPQVFASPTTSAKNKPLKVSVTFVNATDFTAGPTTYQVGLISGTGSIAAFDSSLIPLKTLKIAKIRAHATVKKTFSISLKKVSLLNPGTYTVGVKYDASNAVAETDELDNYAFTGAVITVS